MSISLKDYQKNLNKIARDMPQLIKKFAYQEGETIVKQVKNRTPVGQGHLREAWHSNVITNGGIYEIVIMNNTNYALFVEKGFKAHFVPGHWSGSTFIYEKYVKGSSESEGMFVGDKSKNWQDGKFMMQEGVKFYIDNIMKFHVDKFLQTELKNI